MIFYRGNGKKECELSKSQLCPARSNRRPLLVRLSLYLPFPAAFPRKFPFSFSFRIFYLRIFLFHSCWVLSSLSFLPNFFLLFLQSWYLYFALPFCFLPTTFSVFFVIIVFSFALPPQNLQMFCAHV